MTKAAYLYCSQVNKALNCPKQLKKAFLRQLREEARFFCEERSSADIQSLYDQFGLPEAVAEEFLAELNPSAVAKCVNRRRKALTAAITIVLFTVVSIGILAIQNRKIQQRIDEEFVVSVIYKEDIEQNQFWIPFQDVIFWNTSK